MARRVLDHTSVRIKNLEQSRGFYEGVLGLRMAERPDLGMPGAWYELGQGQLHLIQCEPMFPQGIDPTNVHFAIQVEDLDAVRRQLQAAGIQMLDPGSNQLWVHDPDGNTVEICTARTPPK